MKKIANAFSSLLVLFFVNGCATSQNFVNPSTQKHLISGELIFGKPIEAAPAVNIFALTDEMKIWAQSRGTNYPHAKTRLKRLLQAMLDDGLLSLDYDLNRSLTARETFEARQGNCLSFSILFVALAREVNLDVQFQMVDIPPSFTTNEALVMLNNHINVLVSGIRNDVQFTQNHTVDFNSAEYNGNYDSHRVSDEYATSLYHSNLAIEHLGQQNYLVAFQHLKRGIQIDPTIADLWANLGVLYTRARLPEHAERAHKQALAIDANNKTALVNLVRVTRELGREAESKAYRARVRNYVRSNPYYYGHNARMAIESEDFSQALEEVRKAIRLKNDEHQFYHIQGIALYKQGNFALAKKSFLEARKVAHRADLQRIYSRKISSLIDEPI